MPRARPTKKLAPGDQFSQAELAKLANLQSRAMVLDQLRTPREVMLSAMWEMERLSRESKAEDDKLKFMVAAVNCARYVAPYVHPKLVAVAHEAPEAKSYVIRAPSVENSPEAWQASLGPILENEVLDVANGEGDDEPVIVPKSVPYNSGAERSGKTEPLATSQTGASLGDGSEASHRKPTLMPPRGQRVAVQPLGTDEWLDVARKQGGRAGG